VGSEGGDEGGFGGGKGEDVVCFLVEELMAAVWY